MKRRSQPIGGIGALLVALAVGTFVVFGGRAPEAMRATSDDGRVSVSGEASPSLGALSVATGEDASGPASRVGPVYEVTLGGKAIPSGFDVTVGYDAADLRDLAPNRLAVYVLDRADGAWIALPSVVDPAARVVSATSAGIDATRWTLGAR